MINPERLCECHGEPMYVRYRASGSLRSAECVIRRRESERRRYKPTGRDPGRPRTQTQALTQHQIEDIVVLYHIDQVNDAEIERQLGITWQQLQPIRKQLGPSRHFLTERECVVCGKSFKPRGRNIICCSRICGQAQPRRIRKYSETLRPICECHGRPMWRTGPAAKVAWRCAVKMAFLKALHKKPRGDGTCTLDKWLARQEYYGGRCWMCGEEADSMDHVIPLTRGGTWWPANLRPACTPCNSRKGNRDWRLYSC